MNNTPKPLDQIKPLLTQQLIEDVCEWAIMHGVAFKQADNTARHCPFSIAPTTLKRDMYQHLLKVTPLIAKLVSHVAEDHAFLQQTLSSMAKAEPFFARLMAMHDQLHSDGLQAKRQPLLLMRTDYMDDRELGAKVIEFNGIAAGMAPFGQRASELHRYLAEQWADATQPWQVNSQASYADNHGMEQLALGIATAAKQVRAHFSDEGKPLFLMVVQPNEDNVYDQHLLEQELQKQGVRTVRRTFAQLSHQLSSGENHRLMLDGIGGVDTVYLRAGYQESDYCDPEIEEINCCETLSQTRVFIEQHYVAMNATIGQQLATSKSMQMILTEMPAQQYLHWGLTLEEAMLVKSVLAEMKPVTAQTIEWFEQHADQNQWVLKNQGEGGGHCIFGEQISEKLHQLKPHEYDAWALMQRLYPHERETPTVAVRDAKQTIVDDLISEIGLFTAHYQGKPVTDFAGYAGYLIRSKPASENEGGIHSGKGILDSLMLVD